MTHGKITDIDVLKKVVRRHKEPTIAMDTRTVDYVRSKDNRSYVKVDCAYSIYRTDTCGVNSVLVVKNSDGSYHLMWESGSNEVNQRILRAVQRIMELYEEELKAKEKKDKTYDEEQTDKQNELVSKQAAKKQQHVTA